jgi:hypothetical protein
VCCSPRGDFTRLLYRLWQQLGESADENERVTHLLVETTGVADVLTFARIFFRDAFIAERFRLDAVVAVVDGASPPPPPDACADAPSWLAAATEQLAAASVVCVNVRRRPASASAAQDGSGDGGGVRADTPNGETHCDETDAQQQKSRMDASVDAGVELATGAAGAASDLASVLLDAASQLASVTLSGASTLVNGVGELLPRLARLDVDGSNAALGQLGSASLQTASSGAGVLLDAATVLGSVTVERADVLSQRALLAAADVTAALIDDTAALPGHVGGLSMDAAWASVGLAATVVSAATVGFMASHAYVSEVLRLAAPQGAPSLVACLAPGEPEAAEAGAALWAAIAGDGAFKVRAAVALDSTFLAPADEGGADADDVAPLVVPSAAGGHAARVTCVCVAEAGTPVVEAKLRAWLTRLAAEGHVPRAKGRVRVRDGADGARVRTLVIDGVGAQVSFVEQLAPCGDEDDGGGADADLPLCGDEHCTLEEHARRPADDVACDSKIFMVLAPSAASGAAAPAPAQLKRAFRECFVPDDFFWAADVEIDFPPLSAGSASTGIERQLEGGPKARAACGTRARMLHLNSVHRLLTGALLLLRLFPQRRLCCGASTAPFMRARRSALTRARRSWMAPCSTWKTWSSAPPLAPRTPLAHHAAAAVHLAQRTYSLASRAAA